MDPIPLDPLLELLVARWHDRVADLPAYLLRQFGFRAEQPIACDRLELVRMADGDMAKRRFGLERLSKWEYAAGRLRPVSLDRTCWATYDPDSDDELFRMHSFIFFIDGSSVLLAELYGPGLFHRLIGEMRTFGGRLGVDWKTVWCTTTAG